MSTQTTKYMTVKVLVDGFYAGVLLMSYKSVSSLMLSGEQIIVQAGGATWYKRGA